MKTKEEIIEKALPDMLAMFKSDIIYPSAKLYEGKEGVKQVFENILEINSEMELHRFLKVPFF